MKDHTESILVSFNPSIVSYEKLLDKFFTEHNCSQRTEGMKPQYINAVWYKNDAQKKAIDKKVASVGKTVNTRIAPAGVFYKAEEYHQKYIEKQGGSSSFW